MNRIASTSVYVVAVLALQLTSAAQDGSVPPRSGVFPYSAAPQMNSLAKFAAKRTGEARLPADAFNGFSGTRLVPDLGAPGSAGNGFSHFSLPMDKYTNWYRPRAATLTQYQRCEPDSFRPRGFGHLFARPCDGFRMDYEPYALSDGMSSYGPSYLARMPDPRCPHCDPNAEECEDCRKSHR